MILKPSMHKFYSLNILRWITVWRHHFFTHFYKKGYLIEVNKIIYYFILPEKVVAPYRNFSVEIIIIVVSVFFLSCSL